MNHQGEGMNSTVKKPDIEEEQDPEQMALQEVSSYLIHKFRNPLGGIKGFAALLERDLAEQPDLQKMAAMIVQGTDSLNDMFNVILEYCEPLELNLEETDIFTLLRNTDKNPRIQWILPDESLAFLADPAQLQSAFSHLIHYAFLSMNEKGVLTVTSEVKPKKVIITFTDQGVGIPKERLSKAFSPFFTAPCGGEDGVLSKVKKIIRAHLGSIKLESIEEKGTTFIVTLPIRRG